MDFTDLNPVRFTATVEGGAVGAPEPGSIALLAASLPLLGIGIARRLRSR